MKPYDITFSPVAVRSATIACEIKIVGSVQSGPGSVAIIPEGEKLQGAFSDLRISPTDQAKILESWGRGEPCTLRGVSLDPEHVALFGWTPGEPPEGSMR